MIPDIRNKRIIIAPLNWGLGHATRCVPIIRHLISLGNKIAIASDGAALTWLGTEFPSIDRFTLPAYDIRYQYDSMIFNMALQGPKVWNAIKKERQAITTITKKWNADIIISDNRLGCKSDTATNIYITHQLRIPHPNKIIGKIADYLHHRYINRFDECWIPDYEGEISLAGTMTQANLNIKKTYIGTLSRFQKLKCDQDIDLGIILSGPEPQRTKLEDILIKKMLPLREKSVVLVRGTSSALTIKLPTHIQVIDLAPTSQLNDIICRAQHIICRSGYSSVMDLAHLGKGAVIIPTPGQYEQEYLGKEMSEKTGYSCVMQRDVRALEIEHIFCS